MFIIQLLKIHNVCGTPAQSNRFTLHCQPRDQVFWQCTTYWYKIQPLHNNYTGTKVRDYNCYEAWRHISCGNTINIIYVTSRGLDTIDEGLYGSGITRCWSSTPQERKSV